MRIEETRKGETRRRDMFNERKSRDRQMFPFYSFSSPSQENQHTAGEKEIKE